MKKIITTIQNKLSAIATRTKTALANTRGEGYVDTRRKDPHRGRYRCASSRRTLHALQHDDHADCDG